MTQARSISYDEVMTKILPIAQRIISYDKKTIQTNIPILIGSVVDDIKIAKSTEKDADKLMVLNDAESLVGLLRWGAGLKQQSLPSLMYSVSTFLLWSSMPRWMVDNRQLNELAKDILSKAEIVKQKQGQGISDQKDEPVITIMPTPKN